VSVPLPRSREADVAANREARLTGRQVVGLWYSGLWRLLVGFPLAVIAGAVAWQVPFPSQSVPSFLLMALAVGLVGYGTYLSWRAFSFIGDAITRNVTYITARLDGDVKTSSKGAKSYFMVLGPVRTQIYRKKTFDALPVGVNCHAYYTSGSLHLLSLEPATADEPHPSLRFGGDPQHAWDRLRWSWLVPAVAVFGLAVGAHAAISAHTTHWALVSGRIIEYHETHGKSTSRYFSIDASSEVYSLNTLHAASPPAPDLDSYIGDKVDLYINSDDAVEVLAMRLRETLYTSDLYLHPEHQFWGTIWSGSTIALISVAVMAVFAWGIAFNRKRPESEMTDIEKRSHAAMHM
jgi:hypothetical protein